ncbi:MAG: ATP-dependent zinc protease [Bacteroidota bacterium]
MSDARTTIGRREWASIPEFGLINVKVKIDTGAYSSSIHASLIEEKNGILYVIFLDPTHPNFQNTSYSFKKFRIKKVKSSNGIIQERYFIKTKIFLGQCKISTEISITQRNGMRYPILIGRKLLNNRFIIDTSLKYTLNTNS